MENHLSFFHKKESWSINEFVKERCNKKLPVFEKPLLQLEAKRKTCSFQSGLLEAERNGPSIHPSIQGNPSQLPWIGKQDTSWIDQLSFKGLIHRDNHLYSHTVNLELEANLTSMSLDYERNPESHLTTPWGERTQSKGTLKSLQDFLPVRQQCAPPCHRFSGNSNRISFFYLFSREKCTIIFLGSV